MKLGPLNIPRAVLLAPMENVTDSSFRVLCRRLGADIVYTEFVNAEGLVRNSNKTRKKMVFLDEERPIGIQIYGGAEASMEGAARMAEELRPDIIDINCGCWVKNIAGHGAGAGLLRDLVKMEAIITTVVKNVRLPVTVKTRLGWDENSIRIVEVAKMVEQSGAAGLTIHCRTRAQGHQGEPDYRFIPAVKGAVSIPVIVNGGITSVERAMHAFDATGCDGIMIARGAIDNPWIFQQIRHRLSTGEDPAEPRFEERIRVLTEHLLLAVRVKGESRGVMEFRKHYAGYLRGLPGIARLRAELMHFTEMEPILNHVARYAESLRMMPDLESHPALTA